MTVPPPPPTGPPAGGYFGGPITSQVAQYGYAARAPTSGGQPPATAGSRTPELVTVACTLLGVFAAVGVFTILVVLMVSSSSSGSSSVSGTGTSDTGIGLGAAYAVLWGGSGFINVALIFLLRQGNNAARIVASVICGLWTLYWLRALREISGSGGSSGSSLGSIVHIAELLMIGLAVASALPAALLWRPSAREHFA